MNYTHELRMGENNTLYYYYDGWTGIVYSLKGHPSSRIVYTINILEGMGYSCVSIEEEEN